MSKTSAGPWKWENWIPADGTHRLMASDGDSVLRIHDEDDHNRMPIDADARLVAAAPEMLELLQEAWDSAPPIANVAPGTWLYRARKLLKRIEGEP